MSEVKIYVTAIIPSRKEPHKYLTVRHALKKEHIWRFPGGKIEPGEFLSDAIIRELREELNIVVTHSDLTFISSYTTSVDDASWVGYFFLVSNYVGIPTLMEGEKHTEYRYMNLHDLVLMDSNPEFRAVAQYERSLKVA